MNIRPAKLSDYDELMKLYSLLAKKDRFSQKNNDSFNKVINNPDCFIFVAVEKNKLIGFAAISIRFVVRYPQPISQLEELFVLEDYRKRGIGKRFIEKLEYVSKKRNCCNIYIESRIDLTPAHKFYSNLGYEKNGYYFKKIL